MTVADMQACLAHLYVSDSYRRLFYAAPDVALADYELSNPEAAAIRALDRHMLEVFAGSLKTKRKKRIERAYPASFALDRAVIEGAWRRYLELSGARPAPNIHVGVLEFGMFAEQMLAERPQHAGDRLRRD